MPFTTPEKKLQNTVEYPNGVGDAQFCRELGALLGPNILSGNSVDLLNNGEEIFPAMLAAIRGARSSITFETYIYWSGATGRAFAEALAERAQRRARARSTGLGGQHQDARQPARWPTRGGRRGRALSQAALVEAGPAQQPHATTPAWLRT